MDIDSLTETDVKKLARRLANLPDAELLFWDRRVQAARRRKAEEWEADVGGSAWDGWQIKPTSKPARSCGDLRPPPALAVIFGLRWLFG